MDKDIDELVEDVKELLYYKLIIDKTLLTILREIEKQGGNENEG